MNKIFLLGIAAFSILAVTSCETEDKEVVDVDMEEVSEESNDSEDSVLGTGSFEPNNDYNYPAEGNFTIVTNDEGTVIELDENFVTQSLPDLVIYLSNESDNDDNASVISEVLVSEGAQSFVIPENLNPDDYTYVLLFCRMYNVRVGFGAIER